MKLCRKTCNFAKERDIVSCCLSNLLNDKKPKAFNLKDLYQIFKIHTHQSGGFFARSIVPDGIPPTFLRTKGWTLHTSSTSYSKRSCRSWPFITFTKLIHTFVGYLLLQEINGHMH